VRYGLPRSPADAAPRSEIGLPATRQTSLNPFVRRDKPEPTLIDMTPLTGALTYIRPISFQQVGRTSDEALFNSLIEHHHYLGYEHPVSSATFCCTSSTV
jgi:hypothetical protein